MAGGGGLPVFCSGNGLTRGDGARTGLGGERLQHGGCDGVGVVGVAECAVMLGEIFDEGGDVRDHNRRFGGKGFEGDEAETFLHRWEDERIGEAVEAGHVRIGDRAGEDDMAGGGRGGEDSVELLLVRIVVKKRGATGDDELGGWMEGADAFESMKDIDGIFTIFDAADGEEYRAAAEAQLGAERDVAQGWRWRETLKTDAVRNDVGVDVVGAAEILLPGFADAEELRRRQNAAILPGGYLRVGESIDMVDGADEIFDNARGGAVGQGVGIDAVLGVVNVEMGAVGADMGRDFCDSLGHHGVEIFGRRGARDGDVAGGGLAEKPGARGVGGVDGDIVAGEGQRMPKFQRVDHTAARVGGMGVERDFHAAQPMRLVSVKRQSVASCLPSRKRTMREESVVPMVAAAMFRA